MVWIIALLCLGLVGAAGYRQGPIRAGFGFFGLLFGMLLAGPLSPLTKHLLPLIGLRHPAWNIFAPRILAFLIVLAIFKIGGQVVHQRVAMYFKYKVSEQALYRWMRVYSRLGLCVGILNGACYFILLTLLVYCAGYFTTEAATGEGDPAGVRFLTATRAGLHDEKMDRVLASYDFIPNQVYQMADVATLILHNPPLLSRLGRYPPCLQLAQRSEFRDLESDEQLQQMIATQSKITDILNQPRVHALLTNGAIIAEVRGVIGHDLDDLQTFLLTDQSPKYDLENILGIWDIDRAATFAQLRKKEPTITSKELGDQEQELSTLIEGLSLTATPDNQLILKRPTPNNEQSIIVASGTWKKEQETYEVNLPGSLPETSEIDIQEGARLFLPKFGKVLAFDKKM